MRRLLGLVIRAACLGLSAAGAIACALIALLSSVPVPPVPDVIWVPLVIGVFPLILPAVGRHLDWNLWLKAAFALALVCFVSGIVQAAHGAPEIIHGAYYEDSHGTLTRVSHATYLWAARAQVRMASGVVCLFYVGAATNYAERWLDD